MAVLSRVRPRFSNIFHHFGHMPGVAGANRTKSRTSGKLYWENSCGLAGVRRIAVFPVTFDTWYFLTRGGALSYQTVFVFGRKVLRIPLSYFPPERPGGWVYCGVGGFSCEETRSIREILTVYVSRTPGVYTTLTCYYFSCQPTMCSMIFNMDHS